MSTIDILRALQSEVGSRRAGTAGERRAQEWLKSRCQVLGLPVELDEFTFIGSEYYRSMFQLFIFGWTAISITLSFSGQPLLGAAGFLLMFLYLNLAHKHVEVRLARAQSYNVIAGLRRPISDYVSNPNKGIAFLICAHYDTPRNAPFWQSRVRGAMRFLLPLSLIGIILYIAFMMLQALAILIETAGTAAPSAFLAPFASWIGWVVFAMTAPLVLYILLSALSKFVLHKTDSPGADDNGSGTAVVLDLAQRLKAAPPAKAEAFFAWWGAEESGLFGSRQFVRRFHSQLDKNKLYVINVDCVGVGERLTVHTGQGIIRRRATDPSIVERIERIAAGLGVKTIRAWESIISGGSSDHAEWVDRGYTQAISFFRENYCPLSLPAKLVAWLLRIPDASQLELNHIHSPDDTLEGINPQVLQQTADVVEACLREIDATIRQENQ